MTTTPADIPEFLLIAILLFGLGASLLVGILLFQIPALGVVVRRFFRLSIARFQLRGKEPIVDPGRQERTARSIDGDILYFE